MAPGVENLPAAARPRSWRASPDDGARPRRDRVPTARVHRPVTASRRCARPGGERLRDAASAAGASAPPGATSAPGVPDTWTWVRNSTGACLTAPTGAPRAGWNWVWNWSCAGDAGRAAAPPQAPRPCRAWTRRPSRCPDTPAPPPADTAVALARRRAGAHAPRPGPAARRRPAAAPAPAAGPVNATPLFFAPRPQQRSAPRPPGAHPLRRPRAPLQCASAVGGRRRRPCGPRSPVHPRPTVPLLAGSSASGGAPVSSSS